MKRNIPLEKRPFPWLKKRAWNLFSIFIRIRDGGICYTCGEKDSIKRMDAGHWRHGKTKVGWLDERNVHCQCSKCNRYLSGNLVAYTLNMAREYGQKEVEKMWKEFSRDKTWKREELIEKIKYYEDQIQKLNSL